MDGAGKVFLGGRVRRLGTWLLVGLCVYWFLPTWYWHIRRTADPFTFNDDARILIWPFLRDANPNLFPNDPFVEYYRSGLPEGFRAIYRLVGWLGWAKATSEVLPYISVLSVALALGMAARHLGGRLAVFVATVLVLGSEPFFDRAGGGLPRAFAFPLVSWGLYAIVTGRRRLLALLAVLGAAFYPVVAALLGLCLLLLLLLPEPLRGAPMPAASPSTVLRSRVVALTASRPLLLVVTFVGIVLLLVPMSLRLRAYGDVITPAMLPDFPEAGLGGRLTPDQHPPFESFPLVFARHARGTLLGIGAPIGGRTATWLRAEDQSTNAILILLVAGAALRALHRARKRPELLRLWILPVAACIGHAIACPLAPRLFLPERYAQFSAPPFLVLLVAGGLLAAHDIAEPTGNLSSLIRRGLAAVLIVGILGGRGTAWVGIEVHVPPQERALYTAISALPVGSRIAGWPVGPLENIPYLAERRVLTNFQLEMPFHAKFTLESRARLNALFDAYFATSPDPLRRLCSEYHVTHLLLDSKYLSAPPPDYYAPHRALVTSRHARLSGQVSATMAMVKHPSTRHYEPGLALVTLSQIPELLPACRIGAAQ